MVASPAFGGKDRIRLTDLHFLLATHVPASNAVGCKSVFREGAIVNTTTREHRWNIAKPPDAEVVARLSKEINVPEAIAKVLVFRGIDDYNKAKAYFRPTLEHLHDPFLMDGMELAVTRLLKAIEQREKIVVFGDYDVDGTNGASMLYLFIREVGGNVGYYIPDRLKEGYGISRTGIDKAVQDGVGLFVSVDCGITAVDQVEYARSFNLDVVICDHHEPGERLPNAYAVLDPIKPGDSYPFKYLCGCGVGFKLIQAVAQRLGKESLLPSYLEFVTLATTADIVPLVDENRVLVKKGFEQINASPRPGIKALIAAAGLNEKTISTGQIVFGLAPRINAAGRLGDATRAVQLLTCENPEEARSLANVLEVENQNRRKIDEDTFGEAQQLAEELFDLDVDSVIVLHQEHWHPGVVGIVASRMVEKYYKPSIMMATVDGVAKGSARSVSGFDVYQALKRCEDKLIQFGGHKYAAGLTVEVSRLDEFRDAFNATVKEMMAEELKTPEIKVDVEISFSEVNPRFIRLLKEFAPFGPSNMKPTFLARNLEVVGSPRIVGKNHLRFKVKQDGVVFDAIGFGLGDRLPRVSTGRKDLECVFSVEENDYVSPNGTKPANTVPQLKVRDIR
ncbi:MAG: single-stranded-DNA-specific exonuclease RecJ [Bacteroidetes bacterium]|nr:single-stranded-DNA-specific exonuclease RecJ [Bacteroidota bacterium]